MLSLWYFDFIFNILIGQFPKIKSLEDDLSSRISNATLFRISTRFLQEIKFFLLFLFLDLLFKTPKQNYLPVLKCHSISVLSFAT
jgi:hypothetical protein